MLLLLVLNFIDTVVFTHSDHLQYVTICCFRWSHKFSHHQLRLKCLTSMGFLSCLFAFRIIQLVSVSVSVWENQDRCRCCENICRRFWWDLQVFFSSVSFVCFYWCLNFIGFKKVLSILLNVKFFYEESIWTLISCIIGVFWLEIFFKTLKGVNLNFLIEILKISSLEIILCQCSGKSLTCSFIN